MKSRQIFSSEGKDVRLLLRSTSPLSVIPMHLYYGLTKRKFKLKYPVNFREIVLDDERDFKLLLKLATPSFVIFIQLYERLKK